MKTTGTVTWFRADTGYGFIHQDGGLDIFVQAHAIQGEGFRTLQTGQRVTFEIEAGPNGQQQASKVQVLAS
jgi:CspA family cold shock protein